MQPRNGGNNRLGGDSAGGRPRLGLADELRTPPSATLDASRGGASSRGVSPVVKPVTAANSRSVSAAHTPARPGGRGGRGGGVDAAVGGDAAFTNMSITNTSFGTPPRPRTGSLGRGGTVAGGGVGLSSLLTSPPAAGSGTFLGGGRPRARSRSGSGLFGTRQESIFFIDAGMNTEEAGGADCIVRVQDAFIETIWAPSRKILEEGRERDMWQILKPLEVHLRQTVMEGYFVPMRDMLAEEEARKRQHFTEVEEERRQLVVELERHLRCVALPTYRDLTLKAQEIEGVRTEIRNLLRLY